MKLTVNINSIKKGIYLAGLSLMCLSVSGCNKQYMEDTKTYIESNKDNNFDNERQAIIEAEDTQNLLQVFNSRLTGTKLTIDDLEYLSQFNGDMFSIKTGFDTYAQGSYKYYDIVSGNDSVELILSDYVDGKKCNLLTGEIAELDKNNHNCINVGEYIRDNNIKVSAYTFPIQVAFTDESKKAITNKYGEEVFGCIREYGIPIKMYDANDFYSVKSKTKIKK